MSGEAYPWFHAMDAEDILVNLHQFELMANAMAELGYAEDAALETQQIVLIGQQAKVRIQARSERLAQIWKAFNWWHSGDSGEDYFKAELERYRTGEKQ